jgi:hypothetical protein
MFALTFGWSLFVPTPPDAEAQLRGACRSARTSNRDSEKANRSG